MQRARPPASSRASAASAWSRSKRAASSCRRRRPRRSHLDGRFRLACRTRASRRRATVRCHTLRRGALRIETETDGPRARRARARSRGDPRRPLRAARRRAARRGRRARSTASPSTSAPRPSPCGSTTSRAGAPRRHALLREPAALRRLRHHGAHPLRRRAQGHAAAADAPRATSTRAIDGAARGPRAPSTSWWSPATPRCAISSSASTCSRSAQMPYRSTTEARAPRGPRRRPRSLERHGATPAAARPPGRARLRPAARRQPRRRRRRGVPARHRLGRRRRGLRAVVDIGTNTEVFVGNRHRLLAASCPAGPAFEGGGVTLRHARARRRDRARAPRRRTARVDARDDRRRRRPSASAAPASWTSCPSCGAPGGMNEQGRFADEQPSAFVVDAAASS